MAVVPAEVAERFEHWEDIWSPGITGVEAPRF